MSGYPYSSAQAPSPVDKQEGGVRYIQRIVFWFLVIICMGSVGSFSLAPHLLPDMGSLQQAVPNPGAVQQTAPASPSKIIFLQAHP